MKLTTVKELFQNPDQYLDQEVTVGGWVRSLRAVSYTHLDVYKRQA